LEGCEGELVDLVGAIATDFPQMTFTDKGGGLTELSAHRGERVAPDRPGMLVMEFSKGPARALGLEFYPENADAFTRELSRVKPALLDWKAKHGSGCEMVMFTVVSAPEHHTAIESVIQQVCRDEAELAPLLHSLEVRVALFSNPEGESVKEYSLAEVAPAKVGWVTLTIVLAGLIAMAHLGPTADTEHGLVTQVITQKIMAVSVLVVLWVESREAEVVSSRESLTRLDQPAG
jgi:hypothetical protein